jgi:conjugative relaxase-like TrwC/TraI family protein
MLRIKHLKSGRAAAGIADYLENQKPSAEAKVGYYQNKAAPSEWLGTGAASLGLAGAVDREQLIALLEGRLPDGTDLSTRGGRKEAARLGTDITLSAMKSYSLMATHDPRLVVLWDESVKVAATVIEQEIAAARLGHGGTESQKTGKLVMAAFRHEDARTVEGTADMDFHTHVLALNMTQRADGEWVRVDLQWGAQMVLAKTADFAQKAYLAKRVQELGYEIRLTKDGWEFAALSEKDLKPFSRRTEQVDRALAARGSSRAEASDSQKEAANLATRGSKSQLSQSDQRWEWRARIREAGIDLDKIVSQAKEHGPIETTDLTTEAVRSAARHLSERETVFSKNQTRLEALRAGMGGATLDQIDEAISDKAAGLIDVGGGKLTTGEALYREQEILARARAGHDQAAALMSPEEAHSFIEARAVTQGFSLSAGQRTALTLSLTSPDRVTGIVGAAGAGKTTSMAGFVEAAKTRSYEVVGIAPSAAASYELKSAGADDTRTLASLLASQPSEGPRIYILDEAGMVSGRDMDALLQRIDSENARLLLVGDPRQLSAVESGSPFQQMLETGAIQHATIDEIQRQRDPALRTIAQAFAKGEAGRATELARPYMREVDIQKAGDKPTVAEKRAAIAQATADDYLKRDADTRDKTLVVSGTNELRQQINRQIRKGLKEQGAVSQESVTVTALDKSGLTREQQARPESYRPGMVIRLEEGRGRARNMIEYTVREVKGKTVTVTNREGNVRDWDPAQERPAGVYQPRDMELSPGDKIVFRENKKGVDRIRNGEAATITRLENGIPIARLDSGKEIALDPSQGQTVDYGWCRTIHASQGATVDHVLIAGEASRAATAQTAYVAASRERDTLKIYTDNASSLEKNWARVAKREHALTATKERAVPNLESLKELREQAQAELGRHGDLSRARDAVQAPVSPTPPPPRSAPEWERER